MVMFRMNVAALAAVLALSTSNVCGFSTISRSGSRQLAFTTAKRSSSSSSSLPLAQKAALATALAMSSNEPDELITSVKKKQLAWDEKSGRFFETKLEEVDCIPEDEFCVTDSDSGKLIRLTTEEKERIFLDALQSYYTSGRQMLSDAEFDLLKEDLTWNGSPVVVMNRKEAQYMAAMQDYLKGTPSISDAEFDRLKKDLMEEGSKFAVQTEPKCYIDTGICKVTLQEDGFRNNLLYLPGTLICTLVWLGLGFEIIEPLVRLNPIVLTLLGTPLIYNGAKYITEELLFVNKLVAYGPCPSCQYENRVYFGDILGVEGFSTLANVKCPNCKEVFNVQRSTLRASTLPKN